MFASEPWDDDRVGMNVLRHTADWDHGGPSVLISDWWARERWGRGFEFVNVAPRVHNQTWPLLRKRDVSISASDLERPGDDPREVVALRHSLAQVRKELEFAQAMATAGGERRDALRSEYEQSLSWRVTRPLRAAAQRLRAGRR